MFFSIIIPVFNAEKYLCRCLESIKNQDFKSYEIIIIDDGSADRSLDICEEYGIKFSNMQILKQNHKGVSSARNMGIKYANGKYILFVDADDKIEINMLSDLYTTLINHKIDVCYMNNHYVVRGDERQIHTVFKEQVKQEIYSQKEFFKLASQRGNCLPGSMWLIVCRKEFLKQNKLYLDDTIAWSEDTDFSYKLLIHTNRIGVCNCLGYNWYIDNTKSSSNRVSEKNIFDRLEVYKKWYLYFQVGSKEILECSKQVRRKLAQQILLNYCEYLFQLGTFKDENINNALFRKLDEEQYIWRKCNYWKVYIYKIVGLKNGIKINQFYSKMLR